MFILWYGYVAFEKPICKYFLNKDVKNLSCKKNARLHVKKVFPSKYILDFQCLCLNTYSGSYQYLIASSSH